MAAFIGALSGLLIGPTTTVFYDTGFLIGLKGFVAAVFAGLSSYPLALVGALGVGLLESFGSFWASAFKEVIVFASILPVLLWRSLRDPHSEEDAVDAMNRLPPHGALSPAFAALMLALPLLPVPDFWITQLNYIGLYALVCARPGAAHRRRRADVVRPGGVRRHRRLHRAALPGAPSGMSPWLTLLVGIALAVVGGAGAGRDHAAHVGPLPAAGHHRLGPGA